MIWLLKVLISIIILKDNNVIISFNIILNNLYKNSKINILALVYKSLF